MGGHRAGVLYLGYGHLMGRSMDEEAEVAAVEIVEPLAAAFAMALSPATPRDNGQRTSPALMEGDGDAFSMPGRQKTTR